MPSGSPSAANWSTTLTPGCETEPSVRLAWSPSGGRHTIWAAASKALRQPSRADTSVQTDLTTTPLAPGMVQVLRFFGNPRIKDEELRDYELGYRTEFTKTFSLDATTFLSFYHHLQTVEPQSPVIIPGSPVELQIPMLYDNKATRSDLRRRSLTALECDLALADQPGLLLPACHHPTRPVFSRSGCVRYHNRISSEHVSDPLVAESGAGARSSINRCTTPLACPVDLSQVMPAWISRLARRLGESAVISLVGQNLLRPRSTEYGDSYSIIGTQSVRSVYAQIAWRF